MSHYSLPSGKNEEGEGLTIHTSEVTSLIIFFYFNFFFVLTSVEIVPLVLEPIEAGGDTGGSTTILIKLPSNYLISDP